MSIITITTVTSLVRSPPPQLLSLASHYSYLQASITGGQRGYTITVSITNPSSLKCETLKIALYPSSSELGSVAHLVQNVTVQYVHVLCPAM